MLRRLFTILSALPLLLCVATCVLWLWSSFHHDVWISESRQVSGPYWRSRRTEVHSLGGTLTVFQIDEKHLPLDLARVAGLRSYNTDMLHIEDLPWSDATRPGFRRERGRGTHPSLGTSIRGTGRFADLYKATVSFRADHRLYAFVFGAAALPWGLVKLRDRLDARDKAMVGRCGHCDYDLRATPGRCPECGAVAAERGKPAA